MVKEEPPSHQSWITLTRQNLIFNKKPNVSPFTGKSTSWPNPRLCNMVYVLAHTLSKRAMYSEKPKRSRRLILSARALHSSLAVVAESVSSVLVVPSMNVTGNMMGFLDLVACWDKNASKSSSGGLWCWGEEKVCSLAKNISLHRYFNVRLHLTFFLKKDGEKNAGVFRNFDSTVTVLHLVKPHGCTTVWIGVRLFACSSLCGTGTA